MENLESFQWKLFAGAKPGRAINAATIRFRLYLALDRPYLGESNPFRTIADIKDLPDMPNSRVRLLKLFLFLIRNADCATCGIANGRPLETVLHWRISPVLPGSKDSKGGVVIKNLAKLGSLRFEL